jgi:hypothetical protein
VALTEEAKALELLLCSIEQLLALGHAVSHRVGCCQTSAFAAQTMRVRRTRANCAPVDALWCVVCVSVRLPTPHQCTEHVVATLHAQHRPKQARRKPHTPRHTSDVVCVFLLVPSSVPSHVQAVHNVQNAVTTPLTQPDHHCVAHRARARNTRRSRCTAATVVDLMRVPRHLASLQTAAHPAAGPRERTTLTTQAHTCWLWH